MSKLTPTDSLLWNLFTKGIKRLCGKNSKPEEILQTISPNFKVPLSEKQSSLIPPYKPYKAVGENKRMGPSSTVHSLPLDRQTTRKLRQGKIKIEATLDLHGMTQLDAHKALQIFMTNAVVNRQKLVLVITGKGAVSKGVLKENFPLWLENKQLFPHVLNFMTALPLHGGEGAWYVRLRSKR